MVLATKNPLNMLSTMGIFAVQLLVLGGRKALPAPYTAMWHGSWVLIQRRIGAAENTSGTKNRGGNDDISICYRNTYHHFGSFWEGSLSSNSSTSSLFLSLSLFTFFFRGEEGSKCCVISFTFHPARSNNPILITIDITFVRHRCCPPGTLKPGFHNHQPLSVDNI